jgi:hypothetical protein
MSYSSREKVSRMFAKRRLTFATILYLGVSIEGFEMVSVASFNEEFR